MSKRGLAKSKGCTTDKPKGGFYIIGNEKPKPLQVKRCPQSFLKFADDQMRTILDASGDYESSNVHGWPDEYAGAITEGVRWYLGHRGAAYEYRRDA